MQAEQSPRDAPAALRLSGLAETQNLCPRKAPFPRGALARVCGGSRTSVQLLELQSQGYSSESNHCATTVRKHFRSASLMEQVTGARNAFSPCQGARSGDRFETQHKALCDGGLPPLRSACTETL